MENRKVLLAVLGGIASGALIALLANPKTKKVARQLENGAGKELDVLKDKYADMLKRLNVKLDALKEEYEEVAS
jgi:hypothetical protein